MALDDLGKTVIFQNSIDVWIALCQEKSIPWNDDARYKKFIAHLRGAGLGLRKYTLCVSDAESADEHERKKSVFAKSLSDTGEADAGTYAIRLNGPALAIIRGFGA